MFCSQVNLVYFIESNRYGGFVNLFPVPYYVLTHRSAAYYCLVGDGCTYFFNLSLSYPGMDRKTVPFT